MRGISLVLFCVIFPGCGRHGGGDDAAYNCGGPKEENLTGDDVNSEAMDQSLANGGLAGVTSPSGFAWSIGKADADFSLKVADTDYALIPAPDHDGWFIMLSRSDDQVFGKFSFFTYTVATAVDSTHCGTGGHKFEIVQDGKSESFRSQRGIK